MNLLPLRVPRKGHSMSVSEDNKVLTMLFVCSGADFSCSFSNEGMAYVYVAMASMRDVGAGGFRCKVKKMGSSTHVALMRAQLRR